MRINTPTVLASIACLGLDSALGFTVQQSRSFSTQLRALTHKDILARARKAAGQPEEEDDEPPQLFSDELLVDMQASLLLLEKRVKNGVNSLSKSELQNLESMLGRIVVDLEENQGSSASPRAGAVASPLVTPRNAAPGGEAKTLTELQPALGPEVVVHNDEEGSEYDGTGGMGLAKGTVNTWVIPGMDEMTGEEYREALQKSVSERQSHRKEGETTGNLVSNNYLNDL